MAGFGWLSENKTGSMSLVGQPKSFLAHFAFMPMTAFTVDRIADTAQCFTEPLEGLGKALPLDMVLVPGGSFEMGSPDSEPERQDTEGPQHPVSLPSFFMGRYPVTQAQWRAVCALNQIGIELPAEPSRFKGDNRPVERVSWYEAVEFCKRLSEATERPYTLPTESQWEYACRANTTTPFAFGKTLTTEIVNYDGNYTYNGGPKGECREETTDVNAFDVANAFGLYDMHGNVDEWCEDHWHSNYEDAPTDGSAWLTDDENASRVIRGGSWSDFPWYCRSATRLYHTPDDRFNGFGFRVCCRAPRTLQLPTS